MTSIVAGGGRSSSLVHSEDSRVDGWSSCCLYQEGCGEETGNAHPRSPEGCEGE